MGYTEYTYINGLYTAYVYVYASGRPYCVRAHTYASLQTSVCTSCTYTYIYGSGKVFTNYICQATREVYEWFYILSLKPTRCTTS